MKNSKSIVRLDKNKHSDIIDLIDGMNGISNTILDLTKIKGSIKREAWDKIFKAFPDELSVEIGYKLNSQTLEITKVSRGE